jgi:F-type H+-transporting ATPase subunit alpha
MTLAEYFRDQGRDVLIIMDDLLTHAKFYREFSLLAESFPGRDSYPGDVFHTFMPNFWNGPETSNTM